MPSADNSKKKGCIATSLMAKLMPGMLSCKQFDNFIVDYLDDRLSRTQSLLFKIHLNMCPHCREYLRGYQQSLQIGKEAFAKFRSERKAPPELQQAVLSALAQDSAAGSELDEATS